MADAGEEAGGRVRQGCTELLHDAALGERRVRAAEDQGGGGDGGVGGAVGAVGGERDYFLIELPADGAEGGKGGKGGDLTGTTRHAVRPSASAC